MGAKQSIKIRCSDYRHDNRCLTVIKRKNSNRMVTPLKWLHSMGWGYTRLLATFNEIHAYCPEHREFHRTVL